MHARSTVHVEIEFRSDAVVYGGLKLRPDAITYGGTISIEGFAAKKNGHRYDLEELSVGMALPRKAIDDIIFETFELEDDLRQEEHHVIAAIPEWNEQVVLKTRAVESDILPDHLMLEVHNGTDWQPLSDVFLRDVLGEEFMRIVEAAAMASFDRHNLMALPIDEE